jgi:hypothetical protein
VGSKCPAIRKLLDSITTSFGVDAFPLDASQPEAPEHVCLSSASDGRFYASIMALSECPALFSIVVELYDPPEPGFFPFEIAETGEFNLGEAVAMLGRYRHWSMADTPNP